MNMDDSFIINKQNKWYNTMVRIFMTLLMNIYRGSYKA